MAASVSDALVFFGATGDLAYKQSFPALQALVKRHNLNIPIIGVAKAGWNLDQLKARALDSVTKNGGVDQAAFAKLSALLQYVDGDYREPGTYTQLKKLLGGARSPLHYLAIPPSMFGPVAEGLAQSGCATDARVVVEKPFGRDLKSAKALDLILHRFFPEPAIFRIDHFLGKEPVQNIFIPVLSTYFSNRSGIVPTFAPYRSRWQKISASKAGETFMKKRAPFGTSFKITCFKCWRVLQWMRPPVRIATRSGMKRRVS
jgi:glucose-6-phosphate 1-dehydrogenase